MAIFTDPNSRGDAPRRVQILEEGIKLTSGDRNIQYGEPYDNLRVQGRIDSIFFGNVNRSMGPAERAALKMLIAKLARLCYGSPKPDTYVDMATYAAIAGEVAEIEAHRGQTE